MTTKNIYIDTNIFIYLSKPKSPFYKDCIDIIRHCKTHKILISTSVETIQEIIHYSKNIKQPLAGVAIARNILKLVNRFYPITESTVLLYLDQAEIYQTSGSRDLLHYVVCLENKIDSIITLDKDFKKFKEVEILKPEEVMTQI
ncbi:type II toxin-antitoxin system VapC family toxin [Candidatus Daviesbacteria bacterium]|nr:type II toxin-antitoxin system VapC family toxin [Candidatus Daviesbacteria bacterium]